MGQLPTWWYRTEYFWIGIRLSSNTILVNPYDRISSLADEARAQTLLPDACRVLVSAAYGPAPTSRETTQGLQRTHRASYRYPVANWVYFKMLANALMTTNFGQMGLSH